MTVSTRDDFEVFADSEDMFFGLSDPFGFIRQEVENALRKQVEGTEVEAIRAYDTPKWLTLGRKSDEGPDKLEVCHFGVCFRCTIDVVSPDWSEQLDATVTMLFRDIDRPGEPRMRFSVDLHGDAVESFDDDLFQERFLSFRHGA